MWTASYVWAVLLLGLWLGIPTPGPNTFRPQLNVEYNAMVPERPARADDMHIAVGRFDGYGLVGGPPVFAEFSLRDLKTNAVTKYLIAQNTTIDGIPLKCETSKASGGRRLIEEYKLCDALPQQIIPGKTVLVVLFWNADFTSYGTYRATDTIMSVTRAP